MSVNPFDFRQLIAPLTQEDFFSEYWERKPLVLTERAGQGYEGLLDLKNVDFLLSTLSSPNSATVRFVNNKKELRNEEFLAPDSSLLNMKMVMAGFSKGNTIILNGLHNRWEPIRKLCYGLENVFGHSIGANMYLTPSNAQGFQAHFDAHDVLILQLEGEKLWKIYDSYLPFPIKNGDTPFFDPLNPPVHEVYLKPGDLLYIPRGYVHEALTTNQYSMHLTVGIHVLTWIDLVREMALSQDVLRRAVPPSLMLKGREAQIAEQDYQVLEKLCADKEIVVQALATLQGKFSNKRKASFENHLSAFNVAEKITKDTLLRKKENQVCKLQDAEEHVNLHFGGHTINMPAHVKPSIEYIIDRDSFSISTMPDHLSEASKFVLIRALIKQGLLAPIETIFESRGV